MAPYSENVSFRDFFFFLSWELRTRPLTEEARTAGAAGTTGLKGHFKQKLKNHNDLCVCVCVCVCVRESERERERYLGHIVPINIPTHVKDKHIHDVHMTILDK